MKRASNMTCLATARFRRRLLGVHTLRAVENFPISGRPSARSPNWCGRWPRSRRRRPWPMPIWACCSPERRDAIVAACEELRAGKLHDQFVVDQIQGGAGHLDQHERQRGHRQPRAGADGPRQGRIPVSAPERTCEHGQSTNDVYPTALRLAAWRGLNSLIVALECCAAPLPPRARNSPTS